MVNYTNYPKPNTVLGIADKEVPVSWMSNLKGGRFRESDKPMSDQGNFRE